VPFGLEAGVKDIVFTRTPDKPAAGQAPAR